MSGLFNSFHQDTDPDILFREAEDSDPGRDAQLLEKLKNRLPSAIKNNDKIWAAMNPDLARKILHIQGEIDSADPMQTKRKVTLAF